MSKEAAVRAMREARYAAQQAQAAPTAQPRTTARPAAPVAPPAPRSPARATPRETPADTTDALCGHRSMNGRTCTRELGHTAKNHRYS